MHLVELSFLERSYLRHLLYDAIAQDKLDMKLIKFTNKHYFDCAIDRIKNHKAILNKIEPVNS